MSTANQPIAQHPNTAVTRCLAERLADLGDISPGRITMNPPPGRASFEDLLVVQARDHKLYEWVDNTLVEKAMGWQESMLAMVLVQWLRDFLEDHDLGIVTGPDGLSRLFADTVRGPDVAFVRWERMPGGRMPTDPIPDLVPDLTIEVLSVGNTRSEMARKRREYFQAGVRMVWMVDPRHRTVAVFSKPEEFIVVDEAGFVEAPDILPGWTVDLAKLFGELDRSAPKSMRATNPAADDSGPNTV